MPSDIFRNIRVYCMDTRFFYCKVIDKDSDRNGFHRRNVWCYRSPADNKLRRDVLADDCLMKEIATAIKTQPKADRGDAVLFDAV
jgi:hypothetical protein